MTLIILDYLYYKVMRYFLLVLMALSSAGCHSGKQLGRSVDNAKRPYLIILSMDGFRWDYPNLYATPNLDSIARIGVKASSLEPSFPSKTFPNHYTIATGWYPGHHGIVLNSFYDPKLGEYKLSNRKAVTNPAFYGGEPIWVTAEKQHVRSACFFWPGSEAPIKGIFPEHYKKYDASVTFASRVDTVIAWLRLPPARRPHLILWYVNEPDRSGHLYGPRSQKVRTRVESLDSLIGAYCRKIRSLPQADSINLVFTSDHGMETITRRKSIALDDYIPQAWLKDLQGGNPVIMLQPRKGYQDSVVGRLSKVKHMQTYTPENMPVRFHYTGNPRIYPVVCVADSAWSIYWDKKYFGNGGTHGYDPGNRNMHALLEACGPSFKSGVVTPDIKNVDLYNVFSRIMGLSPAKNDGSTRAADLLLR